MTVRGAEKLYLHKMRVTFFSTAFVRNTNVLRDTGKKRGGPGSNPGLVMWDFVMDKSGAGAGFL
jgi:hypothetical protein